MTHPGDEASLRAISVSMFFDQGLFLDGVHSFERIYSKGKLQDVDPELQGSLRLECGSLYSTSSGNAFEPLRDLKTGEVVEGGSVEFLSGSVEREIHVGGDRLRRYVP